MSDQELHEKMRLRDALVGLTAGGGLGMLGAHHMAPKSPLAMGVLGIGGMAAGGMVGRAFGDERATADQVKHQRHLADKELAQQHRKDLIDYRKTASISIDAVSLAAMRDELANIEKVAINLAPLAAMGTKAMGAVRAAAPKVLGAAESLGSKITGGALQAADRIGGQAGNTMFKGIARAENALGSTQRLNQVAGGVALGGGALAAGGAARAMMGGGQPQTRARY